jgi:hypothetical protein
VKKLTENFTAMKKLFTLVLLVFACNTVPVASCWAQEEAVANETSKATAQLNLGADLVSRYIWRGRDYGNSPAIQPNVSFSVAGFKIGAWGSYAFAQSTKMINDTTLVNMGHYAEMDLYACYTYKWFTLQVTDYFFPNPLNANDGNKYYNYKNATTGHTFEGCLMFAGPDKFPLQLCVATLFYGADKGKDSLGIYGAGTKNNYSTYLEAAYIFKLRKIGVDLKPFIGGIPFGSAWYGDHAGVVNCGFTASKTITITEKFTLPLYVSAITNPQAQSVFLVVGVTL